MFPEANTYPPYYTNYFKLVEEKNLIKALESDLTQSTQFISSLPNNKIDFAYEKNKWTIKQVLQHIIDSERILTYRALHIARKDKHNLQTFNENEYADNTINNQLTINDLVNDFNNCRNNTISLFKSFTNLNLIEMSTINTNNVTPLSIGYFICGHTKHHLNILKKRYLLQP